VSRLRRGGFIFVTWVGDHGPRHVHVFRDGRLVVKWDRDNEVAMTGQITRRLRRIIEQLEEEGAL
jgi:hypothetical protein